MEEKIKSIVSVFIRVPVEQIGQATPVDRTAVQSSILLHRMYARLRDEGLAIDDYTGIKFYGDLLRAAGPDGNGRPAGGSPAAGSPVAGSSSGGPSLGGSSSAGSLAAGPSSAANVSAGAQPSSGVGIDIEEVAALPRATDFRAETWYTQNFTPGEISYCILQADPYASFAGLFAVKEAMVKADAQFRRRPFHTFEIDHSAEGKPTHPRFDLSISHAGGMAVAVAIAAYRVQPASQGLTAGNPPASPARSVGGTWTGWIALLLAAAALLIALKR